MPGLRRRATPRPSLQDQRMRHPCNVEDCGLGRTETSRFDPAAYYTEDYFSGRQSDGYADYLGAEPVLRREFARSVDFIRPITATGLPARDRLRLRLFPDEAARAFRRDRHRAGRRRPPRMAAAPA